MIQYPEAGQSLFSHVPEALSSQCRSLPVPLQVFFNANGYTRDTRIGVITSDDAGIRSTQDQAPEFVLTFKPSGRIYVTLCVLEPLKTSVFIEVITLLYSLQTDHTLTVDTFFEVYEEARQLSRKSAVVNQPAIVQQPVIVQQPAIVHQSPVVYNTPHTAPLAPVGQNKAPAKGGIFSRLKTNVKGVLSRKKGAKKR